MIRMSISIYRCSHWHIDINHWTSLVKFTWCTIQVVRLLQMIWGCRVRYKLYYSYYTYWQSSWLINVDPDIRLLVALFDWLSVAVVLAQVLATDGIIICFCLCICLFVYLNFYLMICNVMFHFVVFVCPFMFGARCWFEVHEHEKNVAKRLKNVFVDYSSFLFALFLWMVKFNFPDFVVYWGVVYLFMSVNVG